MNSLIEEVRRWVIDESIVPKDNIKIEQLRDLGQLYIRLEGRRIKGFLQRRRNANLEKKSVMLILKQKERDVEYDISNLRCYGNLETKEFYQNLVDVLADGGKLVEEHTVGRPTPAVFDKNKKQIAFSGGYLYSDSFIR
jgi:hypothetical protein